MADSQHPDAVTIGAWGAVASAVIAGLGGFLMGWKKQNHSEKTDEIQRLVCQLDKAEKHIDECNEKHLESEKARVAICGRLELIEERISDCHEERDELKQRIAALEAK